MCKGRGPREREREPRKGFLEEVIDGVLKEVSR